jgi:hypothetical protein
MEAGVVTRKTRSLKTKNDGENNIRLLHLQQSFYDQIGLQAARGGTRVACCSAGEPIEMWNQSTGLVRDQSIDTIAAG